MSIVSADRIINQSMYAKGSVDAFRNINDAKPFKTFVNGGFIGIVYSYVVRADGKLFWMFIDPANFPSGTYFVEHNENKLNVLGLNNILAEIQREQDKKKLEDKGVIQYNIDKYLPYIVGGAIAIAALPTILQTGSKINGMKNNKKDNLKTLLLIGGAAALLLYLTKKKTKAGKPIIEVIDEGFINEIKPASIPAGTGVILQDSFGNQSTIEAVIPESVAAQLTTGTGGGGGGYIDYLGPFKAVYEDQQQNMISGKVQRGNLGKNKTC